jgi:hypothetical protein
MSMRRFFSFFKSQPVASPPSTSVTNKSADVQKEPKNEKDTEKEKSISNKNTSTTFYDVIGQYDWTYSTNKENVPYIGLREYTLIANSQVSSLITSMMLVKDLGSNYVQTGKDAAISNRIIGGLGGGLGENAQKIASGIGNFKNQVKKNLVDYKKTLDEFMNRSIDQKKSIESLVPYHEDWPEEIKESYKYLYLRKPTNAYYIFPYFETNYFNFKNNFDDSYQGDKGTMIEDVFGNVASKLEELVKLFNTSSLTEPGMFIQRPKFYDFGAAGEPEFKVEFYLFNTLNPNSYIKNVKLLSRLVARNTPRRRNRLVVEPSCIYEVRIPGRGFYPYVSMSSLNIEHVGTRRTLNVPTQKRIGNDVTQRNFEMIIPDAFKVTINLTSLTTEAFNFISDEMGSDGIDVFERNSLIDIFE